MNVHAVVKQIDQQIETMQQQLHQLTAARNVISTLGHKRIGSADGTARPKRTLSASARRRIAKAQRARWAAWHKQQRRG